MTLAWYAGKGCIDCGTLKAEKRGNDGGNDSGVDRLEVIYLRVNVGDRKPLLIHTGLAW